MAPRKRLGQLLTEMGVVDEHQLQSALGHQRQWGGKLGNILVQKGFCKEADVVRVLSQHLGMPVVKLAEVKVDPRAAKLVTRQVAEKLRVFPIELSGTGRAEVVTIAMSEPTDLSVVDQLSFHTGKRIKPVLTGESEITQAIALYYGEPAKAPEQGKAGQQLPPIARQSSTGQGLRAPPVMPVTGSTRPPLPPIPPPVMSPGIGQTAPGTAARGAQVVPTVIQPAGKTAPFAPVRPPGPYIPPPIPARNPPVEPASALDEIEPMDLESTLPSLAPLTRAQQESSPPVVQGFDLEPDSLPDDAPMPGLEPIAASTGSENLEEGEALLEGGGSPDEQMTGLEPIAAHTGSETEAPAEALPLETGDAEAAAEPESELPLEGNATPEAAWEEAAAAPPPKPPAAETGWAAAAGGWERAPQVPVPAASSAPGWDEAPPPQVAPDNPFGEARDWSAAAEEERAAAATAEAAHDEVQPLDEEPADELPADAIMGTAEELPADAIVGTADPFAEAGEAAPPTEAAVEPPETEDGEPVRPGTAPDRHSADEGQQASPLEAPAWGSEVPADPWAAAIAEHVGEEAATEAPVAEATERVDLSARPPGQQENSPEAAADAAPEQAGSAEAASEEEAVAEAGHAEAGHAEAGHEEVAAAHDDLPAVQGEPAEPDTWDAAPAAPAADAEVPTGEEEAQAFGADAAPAVAGEHSGAPAADEEHGLAAADDAHAAAGAPAEAAAPEAWGEGADPLAAGAHEPAAWGEEPAAEAPPAAATAEAAPADEGVEAPAAWGDAISDVAPEAPAWGESASAAGEPAVETAAAPSPTADELHAALEEPAAAVEEHAPPADEAAALGEAPGAEEAAAHEEAAPAEQTAETAVAAATAAAGHDGLHAVPEEGAAEEAVAEPADKPPLFAEDAADGSGAASPESTEEPGVFEEPPADADALIAAAAAEDADAGGPHAAGEAHAEVPRGEEAAEAPPPHAAALEDAEAAPQNATEGAQAALETGEATGVVTDEVDVSVESEPVAEGEELGLPGWVAPPPEVQPEGAGWIGQALAETTALSAVDVETLAAVGVDAHDGVGALRILAGLLRALERRQVIDLGELAHDLKAQREEAAANFAPAAEVAPYEEAVSGQAAGGDAPAEVAPDPS